ncbi:hypothetical protein Tco_1530468 [Tanacetum coccineum]
MDVCHNSQLLLSLYASDGKPRKNEKKYINFRVRRQRSLRATILQGIDFTVLNWWYSAFHDVAAMVGAGALSLPYAMSDLDWTIPDSQGNQKDRSTRRRGEAALLHHHVQVQGYEFGKASGMAPRARLICDLNCCPTVLSNNTYIGSGDQDLIFVPTNMFVGIKFLRISMAASDDGIKERKVVQHDIFLFVI